MLFPVGLSVSESPPWNSSGSNLQLIFPPMNFSTELFRMKLNLWRSVSQPPHLAAALFWKHEWTAGTSRLWFQTMAAPELWMVVSSGWGFLGKRRGCCTRLSGAEGSPHRVPAGASPRSIRGRHRETVWGYLENNVLTPMAIAFSNQQICWRLTGNPNDKTWVRLQSSPVIPYGH